MNEIITEHSGNILSIQLNRPEKKNALTASTYTTLADLINSADKNDQVRIILLHSAGKRRI